MKKITKFALFFASMVFTLFNLTGCGPKNTKSMKIALYGADSKYTWNIWAWKELGDNDENYDTKSWPGGTFQLTETDENGCVYTNMDIDTSASLGILFVDNNTGKIQTSDIIVPADVLQGTDQLYFTFSTMAYYTSFDQMGGLHSATITDYNGTTITAKIVTSGDVSKDDFTVTDSQGNELTVNKVSLDGMTVTITLSEGKIDNRPYTVKYQKDTVLANISTDLIDVVANCGASGLGVTLSGTSATFKTWSPLATKVSLLLFKKVSSLSTVDKLISMTQGASGTWSTTVDDISDYKYYKYRFEIEGEKYDVADIWGYAASPDSVASQIVNINDGSSAVSSSVSETFDGTKDSYVNPFTGNYENAVIYEMHIRDWSKAYGSSNSGKFEEITAALKNSDGFAKHLKDLGVTHVQILPMFDYAQKNADSAYNWGYNPYHYNVPEGRYVENMTDGTDAVIQLRDMIDAFHSNGIAVIMDVVYNHTSGTGVNSLYDQTVPKYFYRITSDGNYSNGSGCGNEVATNHAMVRTYVIESLKHWMLDYHVNGFRFDLMGCLEASTMKKVYESLYDIDSHVMVYGEPWTGGTSAVKSGAICAGASSNGIGYGAFDDDFRDAIKGAEYGGFKKGQVQDANSDAGILVGLCGKSGTNKRCLSGFPQLSLHYIECHDNYTLFDKLAISYLGKTSYSGDLFSAIGSSGLGSVKKQDKLGAAYIFLSQGVPFINGGQEFLRTKKGNDNSYISSDDINAIDLSMKTKYADVYNTYKGLIALRKANSDAFGANTDATAETVSTGVTKYVTGDFLVYFNASSAEADIDSTGYTTVVDVSSGTPTESTTLPTSVPAKSFVILKK